MILIVVLCASFRNFVDSFCITRKASAFRNYSLKHYVILLKNECVVVSQESLGMTKIVMFKGSWIELVMADS